ncbi:cell division protein FtsQ/DivIB [Streptococcus pacificus]|uniref:Cell division protein DivIB n=1 Tax=Streptococcus pacificus TaxID=2740577 RepID=A0ABS0ZI98_9STRE|nr:FtsQ-type POTRA domain-containing protein [Streptococcus pacificus]MBJ8325721.1 FtsQ-type POTRA domain-containing protein [Streptococcus pacificus]
MSNKKETPKKEDVLTEWQKKNLEFQKRKQEKERLEKEKQEKELQKKKEEIEKAKLKRQKEKEVEEESSDNGEEKELSEEALGEELSEVSDEKEIADEKEISLENDESPIEDEAIEEEKKSLLPSLKKEDKLDKSGEKSNKAHPRKAFVLDEKIKKALPILVGFSLLLLFSIFMSTPYSKQKQISVAGMTYSNEETIYATSGIKDSDYIFSLITNKKQYEKAVVKGNPWVKSANISYQFPNRFTITVSEYRIVAYQQLESGYQPVIETGEIMPTITKAQMPEQFLLVNLVQKEDVSLLVKELMKLDKELVDNIESIQLANSKTTKDLLDVKMRDGNKVRVPLSQLDVKMPLYNDIAKQVPVGSIIDMEVGVYATSDNLEALSDQVKADNIAKKEEEKAAAEAEEKANEEELNNEVSQEEPVPEEPVQTVEPIDPTISE